MRRLSFVAASMTLWLSCTADPVSEAIDELSDLSTVYVPMDPMSLVSLSDAVAEQGYGQVKAADFKQQFVYGETRFGRAVVAFSSEFMVPESSTVQPMSVTQFLRAALEDESASGVMLDPQSAIPLTLRKSDMSRALEEIPAQPDIPLQLVR
jgi:hypothetical protein